MKGSRKLQAVFIDEGIAHVHVNQCFSVNKRVNGMYMKGCLNSQMCVMMVMCEHVSMLMDFFRYMDLHRDPKQINKEILLERLKKLHPFGPEPPPLPYPAAQPIHPDLTSWERRDLKRKRIGEGKYYDLFRGSNRPV